MAKLFPAGNRVKGEETRVMANTGYERHINLDRAPISPGWAMSLIKIGNTSLISIQK